VIRALEGWTAYHHLIQQDPSTPNVQRLVVALALYHLWCEVIQSAAERGAQRMGHCTPTKVCNFEHVVMVHQEILWLDVSMDNVVCMKVHESFGCLAEKLAGHGLCETPALLRPQDLVKFALRAELEKQKDGVGVLEMPIEPQDVPVFQLALNLDLELHLINEIAVDHLMLPHALQCIDLAGALPSDFLHNSKGALTKATLLVIQELKVLESALI